MNKRQTEKKKERKGDSWFSIYSFLLCEPSPFFPSFAYQLHGDSIFFPMGLGRKEKKFQK